MASWADRWTDRNLEKLETRIREVYGIAAADMERTIYEYYNGKTWFDAKTGEIRTGRSLADRDAAYRKLVEDGKRTEDEYRQWRLNQEGRGQRFEAMRDLLAQTLTDANQTAAGYINGDMATVYAQNRNYTAYQIAQATGEADWTLYDAATVRRLVTEEPDLMPEYKVPQRRLDAGFDLEYGKAQISKYVTSSILTGNSIGQTAEKLRQAIPDMGLTSSIRAARTATTGAQNAGRMDSYRDANDRLGLKVKHQWLATLDARTRHEHQILDGMVAEDGEYFEVNGDLIEYPGDPRAPGYLVYNCRCTLIGVIDGIDQRGDRLARSDGGTGEWETVSNMSYREWIEANGGTWDSEDKTAVVRVEPVKAVPVQNQDENQEEVTSRKEFVPAETIEDAEAYISQYYNKRQFGALGVSYKGISLDMANEVNRVLTGLMDEFGITGIGGIIAPAGNTKLGSLIGNAIAAYSPIRNSFLINRKALKSMKVAMQSLQDEKDAIYNLLNHPERYNWSGFSKKVLAVIERSRESGRATVPDTVEDVLNHEFGHLLERNGIYDSPLWSKALANMGTYANRISGYAGDDKSEYVAESFASWRKGEDVIDPVMREIFESLRK